VAFSDPVATVSSGYRLVDGVLWGAQWSDGSPAITSLAIYIAGTTGPESFDFGGSSVRANTVPEEAAAFRLAMSLFADVCNIDFVEVGSQTQADIILGAVNDADAGGNLGISVPPGEDLGPLSSQQGAAIINYDAYASSGYSSLLQGGYDFTTYLHEFGHTVGLKHPHDRGGGTFQRFPGVTKDFGDYGDFDLNQCVYTVMSYNDGYPTGPLGPQSPADMPDYGWTGTPMAFDIAALQHMYGANASFHTGDDHYVLPAVNAAGTFYSCIWDAGGTDTIQAGGDTACRINLKAATLEVEAGGGGVVSSHKGIFGGFTIAHGAVIENAVGGGGADRLTGNEVANRLVGKGGSDLLAGGNGDDVLLGGGGRDDLRGNLGADRLAGGTGNDVFRYSAITDSSGRNADRISDFVTGHDHIRLTAIDANPLTKADDAFAFIGGAAFSGAAGELRAIASAGGTATIVLGDTDGDAHADFRIVLLGHPDLGMGDFFL